jgi:hypothetical protein
MIMNQDDIELTVARTHSASNSQAVIFGEDYAQQFACAQIRALAEWLNRSVGSRDAYAVFQHVADTIATQVIRGNVS